MRKKMSLLTLCFLLFVLLMGCDTSADEQEATNENQLDVETTGETAATEKELQILCNGSSTLAPVISQIATEFNEKYGTWDQADPSLPEEMIAIYVAAGGSGQGVKSIIDDTATFGMVAREVKEEEKQEIEDYQEYKVGIDALTVAVNPANPVSQIMDSFTKDQIVSLFSGEYQTWYDFNQELPDEEIVVVTRDINGGAHEVFQKNIMGDTEVKTDVIQAASMGELVQTVIDNPNAIGYASYGVARQNKGNLIPMKVDGVEATSETIVDGSYIIQRPLLLIASGERSPKQQVFLDAILSEAGQSIIEEMGFVPIQ